MKIIAEPGRFFANDPMTLAIRIFSRKILFVEDEDDEISITEE